MASESERIERLREQARGHTLRRTMLDALSDGDLSTAGLRAKLPNDPTLAVLAYHLRTLLEAKLVGFKDGLYRLA